MADTYRFGRFELHAATRQLLVDGQPAALGARAFDVLHALIESGDRLVSKDELLDFAWPGVVVEENNLPVQISALRKVLGTTAIATIPGRGYRFTLRSERSEAPSSQPPRRHNLPRPLTSFIGHLTDLAEYARMLEQTRLLTMTGIGGCGKTRLAIKLGEMVLPLFPEGVWFVDLGPVSDGGRVPLTIGTSLGIREERDKPIVETLCERLAGQRMLLVLDNCEHIVGACAEVAERLLNAASHLRVLATSREVLGIPGERAMAVRSMTLPPPEARYDASALESSEAVRLFVDRAQLVVSEFALDSATAPAVVEICRWLDGIPLAIELAAARVKLLSVEQIRTMLDDRFRLLVADNKSLPRHQTLRGVIEWSYEHLATNEQQVLSRLAVFAGGWTLAAAAAVVGDSDDELALVGVLGHLVDKSLVLVDREGSMEPRYRMLEIVREYARERLDAGASKYVGTRHLMYYLEFAEGTAPKLRTDRADLWLGRLDAELANLLAALACCDDTPNGAEAELRLLTALSRYFRQRGLLQFGRQALRKAFTRQGIDRDTAIWGRALYAAGDLAHIQGAYADARGYLEKALHTAGMREDSMTLTLLGVVAMAEGDGHEAQHRFEQALDLSRASGDAWAVLSVLNCMGELRRMEGDLERAASHYEEALAIVRKHDFAHPGILLNLAIIAMKNEQYESARSRIADAASVFRDGNQSVGAEVLDTVTALATATADHQFAARIWGASDVVHEKSAATRVAADLPFLRALITRTEEALGDAAFDEAYAGGRALSLEQAITEARRWLVSQ